MKILENKKTQVKQQDGSIMDYATLIHWVICTIDPRQGILLDEMEKRQRIKAAAQGSSMRFEDADARKLQELVAKHAWTIFHEDLIQFGQDVKDMPNAA